MEFGPFDELTKDFTPERWARIEELVAEMREEDHRAADGLAALGPQEVDSADERPPRHRPGGAPKDSAGTGR
jgi:hypothetical protein